MFIIILRFGDNKANAGQHMDGHKQWIAQGFDDGVFLFVGSLQPQGGGVIIAKGGSLADVQARVNKDPFVAEKIVRAEILEVAPARTDERLAFLQN